MATRQDQKLLRHRWSHEAAPHRYIARLANAVLRTIPFGLKYRIGKMLRAKQYPYVLIKPGARVVQIGAPRDTLRAGRSRAMYFALFAGPSGRLLVVEPDSGSVADYTRQAAERGIGNITFSTIGAWSSQGTVRLYVDPNHPATNFVSGTKEYGDGRMQDYIATSVDVDTLDNLTAAAGFSEVDLVSITTNGSEREILLGMKQLLAQGLPYIALARTDAGNEKLMSDLGYELISHDDRGYTFGRIGR